MSLPTIRGLFVIAGAYDFALGLAFLLFGPRIYSAAGVKPPNHWGYVEFAALLLMVFGVMFFAVARDPARNRNLIPYGMLLKLSYAGLVVYYWATIDCPMMFKPFAVIDAAMLVLFGMAYMRLSGPVLKAAATGP